MAFLQTFVYKSNQLKFHGRNFGENFFVPLVVVLQKIFGLRVFFNIAELMKNPQHHQNFKAAEIFFGGVFQRRESAGNDGKNFALFLLAGHHAHKNSGNLRDKFLRGLRRAEKEIFLRDSICQLPAVFAFYARESDKRIFLQDGVEFGDREPDRLRRSDD